MNENFDPVGAGQAHGVAGVEHGLDRPVGGGDDPALSRPDGDALAENLLRKGGIADLTDRDRFPFQRGLDDKPALAKTEHIL